MKRLAVVVMVIVMSIPVLYIGSTFYAAYFFEHDFTPIETKGPETIHELRHWLGPQADGITEAHGLRYKTGMPPRPLFFYRFDAGPAVVATLRARFALEARPLPAEPPRGERLPAWWQPPVEGAAQHYRGLDRGNPVWLWIEGGRIHLHIRADG
ncbi:MAG: hypothetical protein HUJ28_05605 [Chromatiales bacterium]|nr:hypothetical protein [Chromatiales bacterium]